MTRQPHDLPPWACPRCGAVLDEAQGVGEDRRPRAGDLTLCAYCLAVLAFDAELHLRVVPPAEAAIAVSGLDLAAVERIFDDWIADDPP